VGENKFPERNAGQVFSEIFSEANGTEVSQKLAEIIKKEFPSIGFGSLMAAIENLLVGMISEAPQEEHLGILTSFSHSVALKLYETGEA